MAQISSSQTRALNIIEQALPSNNTEVISEVLYANGLHNLLNDDVLTTMRAHRKSAMVCFLATLATHNDINAERSAHWLDIYQSIQQNELSAPLNQRGKKNVLRQTVSALMASERLNALAEFAHSKGNTHDWVDSFELLIDFHHWLSARALLKQVCTNRGSEKEALLCARALMVRHRDWISISDGATRGVDHSLVADLFALLVAVADRVDQSKVADDLRRLQARSLEIAGQLKPAIQILDKLIHKGPNLGLQIALAQCHCKDGDLLTAIQLLDQGLPEYAHMMLGHLQLGSDIDLSLLTHSPDTTKDFDTAEVRLALTELAHTLRSVDQKAFLVSGTLLGYVREGKLLGHDKDIDVGIIGWESQFDVMSALLQSGRFFAETRHLKAKDAYYMPIVHKTTGVAMDIFFYQECDGQYITGVDFNFGYRQTFAFSRFDLRAVEFLGTEVYIPNNAEQNLSENYGDWKTSDPNYIAHLESPSTIDKGGLAHQLTARLSIMQALQDRKPHKLLKIADVLDSYCDLPGGMDVTPRNMLRLWATKIAD